MKVLDLFCGAGGAAMGIHQALPDAEITGVDLAPQKNYPFNFILGDALTFPLEGYDFVWASPPCQQHTSLRRVTGKTYADWIAATRARLRAWGGPWVMENVPGAPLTYSAVLCGAAFGLKVYRHRLFESNYLLLAPPHVPHRDQTPRAGRGISPKGFISIAGHMGHLAYTRQAMGIDWMTRDELSQAIPPAYSRYLIEQLTPALARAA
jgi:DNA (cytosine-5)-methyltransferase 1